MPKEKISLTNLLGVPFRGGKPGVFLMELTGKYLGACSYCYSSSTGLDSGLTLPTISANLNGKYSLLWGFDRCLGFGEA